LSATFQVEIIIGVARSKTVGWTEGASRTHGERGARAYNGGMRAEPPAGSRDRAPGQEHSAVGPPKRGAKFATLVWYFWNPQ